MKRTRCTNLISVVADLDIHSEHPMEISISVSPEDVARLDSYCELNPEEFAQDFRENLVWPLLGQTFISGAKVLRGRPKYTSMLAKQLQEKSGWLYALFSYWFQKPAKEWPEYFKKLMLAAERKGYVKKKSMTNQAILTGLVQSKVITLYGKDISDVGLKIEKSKPETFYKKYISKGRAMAKYKAFFKNKTPQEIRRWEGKALKD